MRIHFIGKKLMLIFIFLQSFRSYDASNRYIFIPVEIHDVKDSKNSFKKLCRACVPSSASNELINEIQQLNSKQRTFSNNKKSKNSSGKFSQSNLKVGHSKKTTDNFQSGTNGSASQQFMVNNGMNNQSGKISSKSFVVFKIFLMNFFH